MKYQEIPKELISNWFMDKMQFSLNSEQLNDLCLQIGNHAKINFIRCCETLPCKKDVASLVVEEVRKNTNTIIEQIKQINKFTVNKNTLENFQKLKRNR